MTDKEVMQQALEALEEFCEAGTMLRPIERREALRTALEQQAEPVAWMCCVPGQDAILLFDEPSDERYPPKYKDPLYTHLPQRQWVGLTDEEIKAAWSQLWCDINKMKLAPDDRPQKETVGFIFAKAIETKLKERNT